MVLQTEWDRGGTGSTNALSHTHLLRGQEVTNSAPYTTVFSPACYIYVFLQRIVLFAVRLCRYALQIPSHEPGAMFCIILPIHGLLIEYNRTYPS
jgi:hypothetical protein